MAERLAPLDYYKWHWKRFRLSRNVQRLHYVARGFYRELLDEQFAEGFIPDDIHLLADICGCPVAVMQEHWDSLEKFFPLAEPGQRVNPNQESHRTELDQKRAAQSRAGQLSAASKAKAKSTNVEGYSTNVEPNSTDVSESPTSTNNCSTLDEEFPTDVQPEEKRRDREKSRGEKRPSRSKVASVPDPRHTPFRTAFEKYFLFMNKGVQKAPWHPSDGKQLSEFLKANPTFTTEQWVKMLNNRVRSDVTHGENLRAWVGRTLVWASGPTDARGKQINGGNNARPATTAIDSANDQLLSNLRSESMDSGGHFSGRTIEARDAGVGSEGAGSAGELVLRAAD